MIDRRSHPAARRLRRSRDDGSVLFVEGRRLAAELLTTPLGLLGYFYCAPLTNADPVLASLEKRGVPGEKLSPDVMTFVSDLDTPPGLIVLAERPPDRWEEALASVPAPLAVLLDAVQNPANAGAILRSAEGAGAQAVLQSRGGADPLGPKTLRASAGSAFRLPVGTGRTAGEWIDLLASRGFTLLTADAGAGALHTETDWKKPTALVLGGEKGFSDPRLADLPKVRIPLAPPVESLNVAVAAGILLFEAARQRKP